MATHLIEVKDGANAVISFVPAGYVVAGIEYSTPSSYNVMDGSDILFTTIPTIAIQNINIPWPSNETRTSGSLTIPVGFSSRSYVSGSDIIVNFFEGAPSPSVSTATYATFSSNGNAKTAWNKLIGLVDQTNPEGKRATLKIKVNSSSYEYTFASAADAQSALDQLNSDLEDYYNQ